MVTIYDLLEVNEDASKEEIEKAYENLIIEYQTNPILSPEENRNNELILNKLKMGYEILMNDEKRAKYDKDLSKKRAEELIKNVPESVSNNDKTENIDNSNKNTEYKEPVDSTYDEIPKAKNTRIKEESEEDVELTKEEQRKIRKAAKKEFSENVKKVQKAEEEYNKAYNDAYNDYLKKMGYKTTGKWNLHKIKTLAITIAIVILICFIAWIIPPIRTILIDIYEKNIIIKSLVDIVKFLVKSIIGIFK